MKNAFGQELKNDAPVLKSDVYHGEFFVQPKGNYDPCQLWDIPTKTYHMGYLQGIPHIIVEVFDGRGVTVHYKISCEVYSWHWAERDKAWEFAKLRKQHVGTLRNFNLRTRI